MSSAALSGFDRETREQDPVTSMDDAMAVLVSSNFVQALHETRERFPVTFGTMTSLHGSEHIALRRLMNPLFHESLLREWETAVMASHLDAELDRIAANATDQRVAKTDLRQLTRRSVAPVTAALIGLDAVVDVRSADRLLGLGERLAAYAHSWFVSGDISDSVESGRAAVEEFRTELFASAWDRRVRLASAHRDGAVGKDELPRDLLMSIALELPDIDDRLVLREAMLFTLASTDTTTTAVAGVIHHLLPWLEAHPEDRPRVADLAFLQAVAYEVVRFNPVPFALRRAREDCVLPSGREVRSGELIVIDTAAVHRDGAVYGEDADTFNPRRTLPPNGARPYPVRPYGIGFGAGPHMCIGRGMVTASRRLGPDADAGGALGTAIRMTRRLLGAGVQLDPDDPPVVRTTGWQVRYERFPVLLTALARHRDVVT